MKITDIIVDRIINTDLFEMAYQRKRAIDKISNFQDQIAIHLIKYLYYDMPEETKNHWKAELDAWLESINRVKLKNNKKLDGYQYYKILFTEPLGERVNVEDCVKDINKNSGMKSKQGIIAISELHVKLERIIHKIAYDLSNGKFYSINDYL